MIKPIIPFGATLEQVVECARWLISEVKPSVWTEQRRVMPTGLSPYPGPFRYDRTPYAREIVDCFAPGHPARVIVVMKGAQIGFSTAVIEAAIGWIISENPGAILYLSGHADLSEEAMNTKIDQMIDSCGLRGLIRPNVIRKKNQRTGDTSKSKEFPGGSLVAGSANNHKLLRQRSVKYIFADDLDGVKQFSKEAGSTVRMIMQRGAAYSDAGGKMALISSPELELLSNIKPAFEKGDQRYWNWPCPCCGSQIPLHWTVPIEGTDGREVAGMTWKLDNHGRLLTNSVGYVCQKCAGFFDESRKYELNLSGEWIPTAEPKEIGWFSYHLSCLYAPPGMFNWVHYVNQYLEAYPPEGGGKESDQQAFMNLSLGLTFKQTGETPKANELQLNCRRYEIGIVPEKLSMEDGNGRIIILTCACDLNGKEDDARLDWEIVAWSETGANYSIKHGSIGTFIPQESKLKVKADREKWTYRHGEKRSVWPELMKILQGEYKTDTDRICRIIMAGVDAGYHTTHAYAFIDKINNPFRVALKGIPETKLMRWGIDTATFHPGKERGNLYMVEVNQLKDDLAAVMKLKWSPKEMEQQPREFMNYPTPSDGLYLFENFFSHYEAEQRIVESKEGKPVGAFWQKKNSAVQNHFWDVRVYNMVLRDIFTAMMCKDLGIKNGTWADLVNTLMGRK